MLARFVSTTRLQGNVYIYDIIRIQIRHQCDQMARMFIQYFAIYNNKNLPNCI